jgi:hypothetical protein
MDCSIIPYQSNDWGFFNETLQQWTGSIKDAVDGKTDISVSSTAMNKGRASQVDFNVGTHELT